MKRALPVALICACVLAELAFLRVGIDDLDEGYFAAQAWRVAHGQVPFRDFETLYSPGLAYLHAALGANLVAMRALALATRAALTLTMCAMARPLVRNPFWAALPGLFLLIGLDDAPERWEPHPGWLSTLFAVLAAWAVCKRRSLALAGALCALSYLFKQNTGLFMLIAVVVWTRRRSLPALAAFVGVTALWLTPLTFLVGDVRRLAVLVGAVNQAGLVSAPEPTILVPLACLAAAIWTAPRWYLLAGIALFATQYPRMDTLHLAWSAPILLVLGGAALERAKPLISVCALLALVLLATPILVSRAVFVAQPRGPVFGVAAPVQTANDLTSVVAEIQQRTAPGDAIFVYPSSPLLYVLADRPNAARFDHLNPGAASPTQIQDTIASLHDVKLVIVSDFWRAAWGMPADNAPLEDWLASHFVDAARFGAYRVLVPR